MVKNTEISCDISTSHFGYLKCSQNRQILPHFDLTIIYTINFWCFSFSLTGKCGRVFSQLCFPKREFALKFKADFR